MKIAIYGTGMRAGFFFHKIMENKNIEIMYFVQSKVTVNSWNGYNVIPVEKIKWTDFEFLVIATDLYFDEIVRHIENTVGGDLPDKVIKYDVFEEKIWDFARNCTPYFSCKVCDNIVFISNSEDTVIPKTMYISGDVFSQHIIDVFFELAQKYCGYEINSMTGIFLDIGANIGTTSVYVKKKINDKLKVIGFEIAKQNYDMFRVNCIINRVEDIQVECLGLSDEKCMCRYNYGGRNSGGTRVKEISTDFSGNDDNTACMTTLDEYMLEHSIEAEAIDYIWMDTEGHESQIISGAMKTLMKKSIPLLQEYNPMDYIAQNTMEAYLTNIKNVYSSFICIDEYLKNDINVYSTDELERFTGEMLAIGVKQADLFFFSKGKGE